MAGAAAGGMAILPQFQGSYYDLQRQQALAQAMMQNSMQSIAPQQTVGSGQYQIMPKASPIQGLGQLGQALLAAKMGGQVSQGMNNLGMQQWGALTGMMGGGQPQGGTAAQSPQPSGVPSADGSAGNVATAGAIGGAGDGSAGVTAPQAVSPQGGMPSGGSAMNPLGMNPQMAAMSYLADPGKYFETQAQAYKPAEITQQIRAAGIDPNSVLGHQLAQQALAKANYIAPVSARPGGALQMADGTTRYTLPAPQQGGMWATNPDGSLKMNQAGQPYQIGIGGAAQIEGGMMAAKAGGEGSMLPYSGFDQQGNPLPVTNRTAAATQAGATTPASAAIVQTESGGNPNAVSPKGALGAWQVMPNTNTNPGFGVKPAQNNSPAELNRVGQDYYNAMTQRYNSPTLGAIAYNMGPGATDSWMKAGGQWEKLPQETRNYVGKVSTLAALNSGAGSLQSPAPATPQSTNGAIYATPQPGFNQGQTDLQTSLTKKWDSLTESNGQAQNTISYLSNIRGLASKAALGQQSDKINFANGLLSLAGSEKATDAVTANNLLDKYSNQIVARLGTGGLGTDAARSILQSAYPNAHMTKDAINEAVDNLVGASQMTQAKSRLLQGDANARNPQAYNQKEMTFDQNADPRIWQFQNMNPQQRQAFKASMTPEEQQQFGQQMRALTGLGVLK